MKKILYAFLILVMITLLAGCEKAPRAEIHKVVFTDEAGSSSVSEVKDGCTVKKPDDGTVISKWQIEMDGVWTDYDFSTPVTDDITLREVVYANADKQRVLGAMTFASVLSGAKGNAKGDGTTARFHNIDLIELFLSASNKIDESSLDLYYDNGGVHYYYYVPGSYTAVPENLLYCEVIESGTSVDKYSYLSDGESKEISAENFSIKLKLAKGKLVDGSVVEDTDGFSEEVTLLLPSVSLVTDEDGKTILEVVDSSSRYSKVTMTEEKNGKYSTVTVIVEEDAGSSAARFDLCSVTFDSDNGNSVITRNVIKGTTLNIGDTRPSDKDGNDSFLHWATNGQEFDFGKAVNEDTELKAVYASYDDYVNKMIVAESTYRIATILSEYDNVFNGKTSVSDIFPNTNEADRDLASILLLSRFSLDSSEKISVPYDGTDYNYEDNWKSYVISKVAEVTDIKKNTSMKTAFLSDIDIEEFSLSLQFTYKNQAGEKVFSYYTLSNTFSIEAEIDTSSDETITTAVLTSGETTYSTLRATSKTLEDGKTKVVFEYDGLKFTRTY